MCRAPQMDPQGAAGGTAGPQAEGPVFLVGWWRSGTTFFWNLLRRDDRYTCYFEPLHEHLDLYVGEGPGPGTDPTHLGVEDYWAEYRDLPPARFEEVWKPWFGRRRWVLETDADADADDLRGYLDLLVDRAAGRPVLKVVRACFRAAWLRDAYPEATIVHVARDPRCVWTSMVGRDAASDDPVPVERHGFFNAMIRIARELGLGTDDHLYRQFYRVWTRAYRHVEAVADATWWYDDAVRTPKMWLGRHLVEPGWLDEVPDVPVHASSLDPGLHPKSWYLAHEVAAVGDGRGAADGRGEDPRIEFLLQENRHLDDEVERLHRTLDRLERRYERLVAVPPLRHVVRLYRKVRRALGRPVD